MKLLVTFTQSRGPKIAVRPHDVQSVSKVSNRRGSRIQFIEDTLAKAVHVRESVEDVVRRLNAAIQ